MKIAIIPPISSTGESRYNDYLIEGLKQKGIDVEIINNKFLFNRPNVKIFLGSLLLNKILKDKEIDILHNTDNLGPFLVKNNNIKTVLTVHDITPVLFPEIYNSILKFNFKIILPRLIKNTDSIIVSSHSTKKDIVKNFKIKNKINVTQLGIDNSFFYPRENNKDILKKYGIKNEFLMYTGNDNPRKNLKNLILAYSEIYDKIPHDLVLVGPINKENILKIIKSHGINQFKLVKRIIFLGYIDLSDLPHIYSAASAFIFPSLYEGFGFPPLEAMACGAPVLLSNNSSLREIAGNAGKYLKDPLNPQKFSEDILELINDIELQEKLKNKGFIQSKKFNWESTVEKTIKVYDKYNQL